MDDLYFEEELKRRIRRSMDYKESEEEILTTFNFSINCGGYALKIDKCIFPISKGNPSKNVSTILKRFPFVRLLGEKALEDDEYLVIYRTFKKEHLGHHFIRVDSNGTVREKDGFCKTKIFDDWNECYKNEQEVLFAVKKEHQMFGYKIPDEEGLDFAETINQAIIQKNNSFSYHNHDFCLKKSKENDILVTTSKGQIIGDVFIDGEECAIELKDRMEEYVENFSVSIKPIIKDGKLINLDEFKKTSKEKDNIGIENEER